MKALAVYSSQGELNLGSILLSVPVLVAISLISVVGASFYIPLFDLDEGAFSEATREMLESGNWISTYLNGEPRHDKPILIYWLQALSVSVFGNEVFAYRLPSLFAACGWIFVVYRFTKEFYSIKAAKYSVWVLTCSLLATGIFQAATADALLNFFINLIFFDIYRYCVNPSKKALLKLGVLIGLAFLTKGPVVIALPFATTLISLSIMGKFQFFTRTVFSPFLLLPFLIVVVPWHIAVYLDQGLAFYEGFYLGHNLGRYGSTMENHGGSPFYYLILFPVIIAPFSYLFFKRISAYRIEKKGLLTYYLLVWFAITFVLFSFSKTQLPHYLLYGMTPVFIFISTQLAMAKNPQSGNVSVGKIDSYFALIFLILISFIPFALGYLTINIDTAYELASVNLLIDNFYSDYAVASVLLIATALAVIALLKTTETNKLLLLTFGLMVSFNFILGPLVASAQQSPVRDAAVFLDKNYAGYSVVSYRVNMPSISVYLDKIVSNRTPKSGDIIFTKVGNKELLSSLNDELEVSLIYQKGGIDLYLYGEINERSRRF